MESKIVYLESAKRKPVQLDAGFPARDPQDRIPIFWCSRCGSEIYTKGTHLCRRCSERRKRNEAKS